MATLAIKDQSHSEEWLSSLASQGLLAEPTGLEPATSDVTGSILCSILRE
jgi:hypothetical protein